MASMALPVCLKYSRKIPIPRALKFLVFTDLLVFRDLSVFTDRARLHSRPNARAPGPPNIRAFTMESMAVRGRLSGA
jgi:hypothetical protein